MNRVAQPIKGEKPSESGRNETEDDSSSSRPSTSVCVENIDAVCDLIEKDKQITTELVADTLNICTGSNGTDTHTDREIEREIDREREREREGERERERERCRYTVYYICR
ncbi:hypothetical protein FHG87_011469 [Trinorchestia longiramus]|nr:hypothetical protein FHG87_011469 [Trinorchestia longiramus]